MERRAPLFVLLLWGVLLVLRPAPSTAGRALPSVRATVDGLVEVTTTLRRSRLRVGQAMDMEVATAPVSQTGPRPVAVSTRLGMPDHGHWITGEVRHAAGDDPVSSAGEFPMSGRYRLRIWVDLDDGSRVTTAVDFHVPASRLEPVVFATKPDPPPSPAPAFADVGVRAPSFELNDLAGTETLALDDLLGKPVWLAFWASWCGPCRAELPELERFARRWSGGEAVVLAVSLDQDPEMAAEFLDRLEVEVRSVIDPYGSTVEAYGAQRIPLNVLVDTEGRVVRRVVGFRPGLYEEGAAWVEALLD